MQGKGITDLAMVMIQVILLVAALIIIGKFLRDWWQPHRQIAFANAELLANAMEQACLTGSATLDEFNFPQPTPFDAKGFVEVLPKMLIKAQGDPHYLLYYEAFPAGEAIGWERLVDMKTRLIAPLPSGFTATAQQVSEKIKSHNRSVTNAAEIKGYTDIQGIVYPNIILNNIPDDETKVENFPGTVGTWQGNFYAFDKYVQLPDFEKSAVKYRSCGDGNLCLKTRDGVYAIPLRQCKKNKIPYIQLEYDARSILQIGAGGAEIGIASGAVYLTIIASSLTLKSILSLSTAALALQGTSTAVLGSLSYKVSDFYIASPCTLKGDETTKITITKTTCGPSGDNNQCKKMISYPLYAWNETTRNLSKVGDHYACIDDLGLTDDQTTGPVNNNVDSVSCLNVKITTLKNNFCWTANPKMSYEPLNIGFLSDFYDYFIINPSRSVRNKIWKAIGGNPVTDSTAEFDVGNNNNVLVLKDTKTAQEGYKKWLEYVRKIHWGWP